MSQITAFVLGGGGGGGVLTLTGNSGGAVSPTAGNINAVGSGILSVAGNPGTSTLTISATNPIPIANGGTNATSMTNTDGVVYFDGTRLVTTAVGTAGDVLTSNGSGVAPTFQAGGGGGGGIVTINGNSGSVTGSTVSFIVNSGNTILFTAASGTQMNLNHFDGNQNFALTDNAFNGGSNNIVLGFGAGSFLDSGSNQNILIGTTALVNSTGSNNVCVGFGGFPSNSTSENNVGIGSNVGSNFALGNESNNILLNSFGVVGDNHTLRIGAGTGTGTQQLNAAFISGIQGIAVTGTAVLVSASDQLGIAVSSKRFKKNIDDMGNYSKDIHKLRPVTFDYKDQSFDEPMVGLIAEEVEDIMPELVIKDKEGLPLTVKYLDLIPMLLNEVQKLRKELDILKGD